MATATRRAIPAKTPNKTTPASKPAPTQTKAQQAAAAQGRAAPPAQPKTASRPAPARTHTRPDGSGTMTGRLPAVNDQQNANLPAHMRDDANMGKEGIGREDIETPRLKLIQGTSKEIEAYADVKPGVFFHTSAEHIFDEPFRVVPILIDKRYILWRPLASGGGILARADDAINWAPSKGEFTVKLDNPYNGKQATWTLAPTIRESGLAEWGTMYPDDTNSPPAATLMYTFVFAFPDHPELIPAALTFQRSSIKMGRKLLTKLKTVRTPLFGSVFMVEAMTDTNSDGQKFFNINAIGAGLVEDPEMYAAYKDMHIQLSGKGLNIKDMESMQGESDAPGDGEETGDGKQPSY